MFRTKKTAMILVASFTLLTGCAQTPTATQSLGTATTTGSMTQASQPGTMPQTQALTTADTTAATTSGTRPDTTAGTTSGTTADTTAGTTAGTTTEPTPGTTSGTTTDTTPATTSGKTPDTKAGMTAGTTTETTSGTQSKTKPKPGNPIDPDDIRTGNAYDTATVRDWMWNAEAADYYPEKKLVFLTFDDGPSWSVTPKVLDVLEKNDVQGTFFYYTQGNLSDRAGTIKRAIANGNVIAIHTDSHNYSELYPKRKADVAAILSDAKRATEKLQGVLGDQWSPTVYRFPGGSFSWTGSKNATAQMRKARAALSAKGLEYIDWNAMSGDSDAGNKDKSPKGLVNFTVKTAKNATGHVIVVLLHDAEHSKNTPKALQGIIDYFKEEGYRFGVLK